MDDLTTGDSVAINGVCLTATNISGNNITFHLSKTTMDLSNFKIGSIKNSARLNLERAMKPDSRFGGHIVSGHIDGKVKVINIEKRGDDHFFEFLYSSEIKKYIIPKGSVALDGISLTISSVLSSSFIVTVIPETIKNTNLIEKRVGDFVNIEIDIFARYIAHILLFGDFNYKGEDSYGKNQTIIERFLRG